GSTLIYSNVLKNKGNEAKHLSLYRENSLEFANRHWKINYTPSAEFMKTQQTWSQWWLLVSSFLFAGLTGSGLLMLTGRTLRTEELVKSRTQALRKEIAEREKRNNILHAITSPMPLNEILSLIIEIIENDNPEALCSIMLLDAAGKQLQQAASGRLPEFYTKAINGIAIGEGVISCGTAAYLKQRVIVTDISIHPYWVNFSEQAKKAGLAACCSEPIMSADKEVLGTFSIYYSRPKHPSKSMLDSLEGLAQLSSLAIEKKTSDERIRYLAFYDALTKLPNRRLLYDRLTQELARIERHHNYGGLMFLDLDHFKTLNDSLGHHVGDELLIQVAERLKDCVRDEDTVARLGGDEFVVVLRTKDLDSHPEQVSAYALTVAKRIQSALYIPYSLQGYEHVVTSSIGITMFGAENKDIDELFKQADTAMYEAKNKGRNTFSFYSEEMADQADKRLQLESDLRNALSCSQFVLHYQPQHDAQGNIVGAEALLRWIHPEKGRIPLSEFMPTCEESGLILAIGEWTLRTICQQLMKCSMLDHISLNVSSRQFHQPSFTTQIKEVLREYKLSPHVLMLEITEEIIVKDINASIQKLNELQDLGVRISIDDFGIGYSSLADLRHLPIDQIKIDQSFIRDICTDKDAALIVEAMLMMATHLGLAIVAEGVETLEQLEFLKQNKNCSVYQGYYFSKPLPAEDFEQLIINN
ncbi:MAG: EAL domain-containing protein, partial [Methylococcaceae bacterium]|nr:EAL domain-containing protein [Methylococcaceae bacterium]